MVGWRAMMNRTDGRMATRAWFLGVIVAAMGGCGGPAPEVKAADKPPEKAVEAPVAAKEEAPAGPSKEAIETCFATANAKRAKFSGEPPKIGAKHILVKYVGAKKAEETIKRSRAEACLRALEVRDKIVAGADFDEMVKEYSEEAGAASRNGSIGTVERAALVKPFADAAFELSVNQMSDIVETEFGFHLIFRTE